MLYFHRGESYTVKVISNYPWNWFDYIVKENASYKRNNKLSQELINHFYARDYGWLFIL